MLAQNLAKFVKIYHFLKHSERGIHQNKPAEAASQEQAQSPGALLTNHLPAQGALAIPRPDCILMKTARRRTIRFIALFPVKIK